MLKKVMVSCFAMVLGTSLHAKDFSVSEKIIGIEIGAASIQADTNGYLFGEPEHDGSDVEYGLRIGAQMNEWRTLLVLDYFDSKDDDQNYEKFMITVDNMFNNTEKDVKGLQPYIGLNIGYMNYESTNINESGFLYGGQAGLFYRVTDNVGVDVSYRYSLTDADRTDHIASFVMGINYIY
ncbi:outer membrane beta-barrel protein [Sulfurovum sp. ST-21]|uniref:Outer membrane beta-barrel protein n=1 Tax=Sulfurovum indicum TaxID=2779528 RepID=A0A7M1S7J4_9BACT|nr:outer membrane beta-barrel protein [Sulfurovum indicum]QOR62320.1 outer membrane beta-barrel protein [Sulfurovum indicum]